METTGALAPAAATRGRRHTERRPSRGAQRHPLAIADRRALARCAEALGQVGNDLPPRPALAARGDLGAGAHGAARRRGCRGRPRLVAAGPGWHRDSRPCPGGRGKKGGGDQARGRSQGGCSTTIHVRAAGGGTPVTWTLTLTPGQRHEATPVTALREQGAVRPRSGRPRIRPLRVAGDTGSTGRTIRQDRRGDSSPAEGIPPWGAL